MAKQVRIVLYGVNGSGVGHLVRLTSIARWMRRICAACRVQAEISFLTSSEADALLFHENFPSFKLPSKTVIEAAGQDKLAYLALAKQWVWHSLGLLRPDLFVVDTFPRGAFGELLNALDLVKSRAFIYRPAKDAFAKRPDFQAMLPLYDLVLVPDDESAAEVPVPPQASARLRYAGPVVSRERSELLPREEARKLLGIPEGRTVVYATAGGGGDENAEKQLDAVFAAVADDPSIHLVVGAGPLYRGRPRYGERVTWVTGLGISECALTFDVAVSAAGYNSFFELMHLGVPTVFLPQPKIADEQDVRAKRAVDAGAAKMLESLDSNAIRDAIEELRSPAAREQASRAAQALVPKNNARAAAAAMLRLVIPPSEVDAAEASLSDELLEGCARARIPLEQVLELANVIDPERNGREASQQAVDGALQLAIAWKAAGFPFDAVMRVAVPLARRLGRGTGRERAEALQRSLSALSRFDDWPGAAMLVKSFQNDKEQPPARFAEALEAFLAKLHADGNDLYDGLSHIAKVQARDPDATNTELLRGGEAA